MTITPQEFESIVGNLGAEELAQLGAVFTARAAERRRALTIEEAQTAFDSAPLTHWWQESRLRENGQVRIATRILIERGWHPEQIVDSMTAVAERVCVHPLVAAEAVACGIADGMVIREGMDNA
ncbi:MAG TPA: hypothetical protein VHU85_17825 [Acidimicrobiales bacterium]|jgi:hypothetical protein|nr:hypothetical protein [Acidimicrobiales bacterium]